MGILTRWLKSGQDHAFRIAAGGVRAAFLVSAILAAPPALAGDAVVGVPVARPMVATPVSPATAPAMADAGPEIAALDQPVYVAPSGAVPGGAPASANAVPTGHDATISSIRLGDRGLETRFVIEMADGAPVKYQVFTLSNPYRIVIDLQNTKAHLPDVASIKGTGIIASYRYGAFRENVFRVVMDTNGPARVSRDFMLEPQSGFGRRIVLDLITTDPTTFMASLAAPSPATKPVITPVPAPTVPSDPEEKHDRRRIVVIDPGHGGIDPGTHGSTGVLEKDVVLAFSKEFARRLKATGRYDVHLTRDSDFFIPLRERVAIARRDKADLFISVHANSISRPSVNGFSIYTLSEKSSDREAAALAHKENQSDVIAGIDLQGESPEVTGILIDLAQRETKNYSSRFAKSVIDYVGHSTELLSSTHRFAGFAVLKAPDVPSVLIELGFLTNRGDERNLMSSRWRGKVAKSLVSAVDQYFGGRRAEGVD